MNHPQIVFKPRISLLSISQHKLRKVLFFGLIVVLVLFGFYGCLRLVADWSIKGRVSIPKIFYLSLLSDMFLFYLWQRRKEKAPRIALPKKQGITNIADFLSPGLEKSLESAWLYCYRHGYQFLRPIHLFSAFLKQAAFKKILDRLGCPLAQVKRKTRRILKLPGYVRGRPFTLGPQLSPDIEKIFVKAYLLVLEQGRPQLDPLDILWAISQERNLIEMIFDEFGINSTDIKHTIEWSQVERDIQKWQKSFFWRRLLKPKGKLNRAMTAAATPFLDRVSQDLTYLARNGQLEMVLGRQKEIDQIFNLWAGGQPGVVLVGEVGVGKKAVLHKLAQLMCAEEVPKFLQDKRLVQFDLASLVGLAQSGQRGEEHLKRVIYEVNRAGNIILAIENIDNLVGLRSQAGGLEFAEILASALDQKAFWLIGTTTLDNYAAKIERKRLGQVLAKVKVETPSRDLLWRILVAQAYHLEKELKIIFSVEALEQSIDLADRYLYGSALPNKVISLLEETAIWARSQKGVGALIKETDVFTLISQKTGIPLGRVRRTEKETLLNLEKLIHQRIINQEEAVRAVADAMRRSRLNLEKREKTIANFLFVGPTGVGKTELSKSLARIYFGSVKRMIRLDMSEYQEKTSLARLIGSSTAEGINKGYLSEAVKRQPYTLLLLDELEKAHPDILNLFLQVMDDGRLTDISGETINFTNIILIATSNAGTQFIQEKIRKNVGYQEIYRELKERVLLEYFKPEFLNRFDKIVLFRSLSLENVMSIARIFLREVVEKLDQRGIDFVIEDEAIRDLAQMGYDPLYGARPLKRVIQDKVENNLARLFLEDKVKARDKIVLKKNLALEIKKAVEI